MTDETEGSGGATLQELFPALGRPTSRLPLEPLHARVLEVEEDDGLALHLTAWRNPGGARSLHAGLQPRIEGALLSELSRPPEELRELGARRTLRYLRLSAYEELGESAGEVLALFGLRRVEAQDLIDKQGWREASAHLRSEAQRTGHEIPDQPVAGYEASIQLPEGDLGDGLVALEAALRGHLTSGRFGAPPGAFAAALLALASESLGVGTLRADSDSLRALEDRIIQVGPGPIRYLPPLVFQSLADLIGVIASQEFGRRVEWAPSEPDALGLFAPPLVRAALDDGWVHLPLGVHLLRWCVMPLREGEVPAPLTDWVLDQFGAR